MKFLWNKSCFFATIFVFLLIAIISNITLNIQFLEPFGKALSDFKLTDIVYSKLRPEQPIDTNIVLINTGEFPKKKIGEMILAIAPHKPKVIGIDHFLLLNSQDPESDSIVAKALATAGNVTLVSKLTGWNEDAGRWDSLIHSPQVFSQYTTSGFANVITQDFRTVRIVTPIESVGSAAVLGSAKGESAMGCTRSSQRKRQISRGFTSPGQRFQWLNCGGRFSAAPRTTPACRSGHRW